MKKMSLFTVQIFHYHYALCTVYCAVHFTQKIYEPQGARCYQEFVRSEQTTCRNPPADNNTPPASPCSDSVGSRTQHCSISACLRSSLQLRSTLSGTACRFLVRCYFKNNIIRISQLPFSQILL